jgi:alkaline phosphatase
MRGIFVPNKLMLALCLSPLIIISCFTTNKTDHINAKLLNKKNSDAPKNIVLMIVDGMGFEHVKATRIYNGQKPLSFEKFPCLTKVATCAFEGADNLGHCLSDSKHVTDSAAAATAMATGIKVNNGVISRSIPNSDDDIETILEISKRRGKSTGVIATKLFTDATPAAFISHAHDRDLTEKILADIFSRSQPNVIFGADTPIHRKYAANSNKLYFMAHNSNELKKIATKIQQGKTCIKDACPHIYGGFGQHDLILDAFEEKSGLPLEITPASKFDELGIPHLSEMTDAALRILSKNENGFFLMIESSMPDIISHYNSQIDRNENSPSAIEILIREMLEVEKTIKVIEAFLSDNPETLVILTADHETGGLMIENEQTLCLGKRYCVPTVRWTSLKYEEDNQDSLARHTSADVPLYAIGKGAEQFCVDKINNTDIPKLVFGSKKPKGKKRFE